MHILPVNVYLESRHKDTSSIHHSVSRVHCLSNNLLRSFLLCLLLVALQLLDCLVQALET